MFVPNWESLGKWAKKNIIFSTPFLFASYCVLFLYANNKSYTLEAIFTPLLIVLLFSTLVFLIVKLLFRKIETVSLISSVVVFICLSYGRVLDVVSKMEANAGFIKIGPEVILAFVTLFLFCFILFVALKYKSKLHAVNKFAFIFSCFLLSLSLLQI